MRVRLVTLVALYCMYSFRTLWGVDLMVVRIGGVRCVLSVFREVGVTVCVRVVVVNVGDACRFYVFARLSAETNYGEAEFLYFCVFLSGSVVSARGVR